MAGDSILLLDGQMVEEETVFTLAERCRSCHVHAEVGGGFGARRRAGSER